MDERSKKIQSFNVLVHKLPMANFELLRHMASFLIEIVDNSGLNKMTVRNVGIVFAPTLNIPAPLIAFFLTDYPDIFGSPIDEASSPIWETTLFVLRADKCFQTCPLPPTTRLPSSNALIDDHLNSKIALLLRTPHPNLHNNSTSTSISTSTSTSTSISISRKEAEMVAMTRALSL
jgi:hypothetical protein